MASYSGTIKPQVENFFKLFEKLMRVRIKHYIRTHHSDCEAHFLNQFIVISYDEKDFSTDLLRETYAAKRHCEEHLNIKISRLELDLVSLDDSNEVFYNFSCYPHFLGKDYDGEYFYFGFGKDGISVTVEDQIDIFNDVGDEQWDLINKGIEQELYFDTLR